jgi:hypothetical protein
VAAAAGADGCQELLRVLRLRLRRRLQHAPHLFLLFQAFSQMREQHAETAAHANTQTAIRRCAPQTDRQSTCAPPSTSTSLPPSAGRWPVCREAGEQVKEEQDALWEHGARLSRGRCGPARPLSGLAPHPCLRLLARLCAHPAPHLSRRDKPRARRTFSKEYLKEETKKWYGKNWWPFEALSVPRPKKILRAKAPEEGRG